MSGSATGLLSVCVDGKCRSETTLVPKTKVLQFTNELHVSIVALKQLDKEVDYVQQYCVRLMYLF